jgi:hypothetical protein
MPGATPALRVSDLGGKFDLEIVATTWQRADRTAGTMTMAFRFGGGLCSDLEARAFVGCFGWMVTATSRNGAATISDLRDAWHSGDMPYETADGAVPRVRG